MGCCSVSKVNLIMVEGFQDRRTMAETFKPEIRMPTRPNPITLHSSRLRSLEP